jgi:hypothetical protein
MGCGAPVILCGPGLWAFERNAQVDVRSLAVGTTTVMAAMGIGVLYLGWQIGRTR